MVNYEKKIAQLRGMLRLMFFIVEGLTVGVLVGAALTGGW